MQTTPEHGDLHMPNIPTASKGPERVLTILVYVFIETATMETTSNEFRPIATSVQWACRSSTPQE